jgi:hypothetical protein
MLFEGLFGSTIIDSKICTKCNSDLPLSNYGPASGGKYLRSECRKCAKSATKQRINCSATWIPDDDYKCAICKRTAEECKGLGGRKNSIWCKDHDHITGKFRGWLCHSCNRAVGNFNDNTDRLQSAIEYLKSAK